MTYDPRDGVKFLRSIQKVPNYWAIPSDENHGVAHCLQDDGLLEIGVTEGMEEDFETKVDVMKVRITARGHRLLNDPARADRYATNCPGGWRR